MAFIEGNSVYIQEFTVNGSEIKSYLGEVNKTETIRIDDNTVADVISSFNLDRDEYVEASRTLRTDVYVPPVTDQQKIARLEADNADLKSKNAEIILTLVVNNLL